MSEELFRKIINDLASINYSETIGLYSNNEPLLDERILDFYKYAKEKLPNAKFSMYTNGTLLTFEKFLELLPLLDFFVIDNYNDKYEFNTPELKKIYDYLTEHPEINEHDLRVSFAFRRQNEVLTTRGGQAPNKIGKTERTAIKLRCPLPFLQFVIRPTGEVSLCCSDTLGQCTMGDLKTQTISEVWSSEKYQAVRKELLTNGRKNLLVCKNCDFTVIRLSRSSGGVFRAPKGFLSKLGTWVKKKMLSK